MQADTECLFTKGSKNFMRTGKLSTASHCESRFRRLAAHRLALVQCLDLLPRLYANVLISEEVYQEAAVSRPDLPGARQIAASAWIQVSPLSNRARVDEAMRRTGLAAEVSTIVLANEVSAGLVLIDERTARRFARAEGLEVIGCVGILEILHRRAHQPDLRDVYRRLLHHEFRVETATLNESLARVGLPGL